MRRQPIRLLLASCAVVLALLAAHAPRASQAGGQEPTVGDRAAAGNYLLGKIDRYRRETWRWQRLMGVRRSRTAHTAAQADSKAYRHWVLSMWRKRAARARRKARRPPHRHAWMCIHRYERHPHQGWATDTGNGYYGGLQMDLSFMRTYGRELLRRKGTANHWTAVEQMWVAERALRRGRGFYPWPSTAQACNLI